MEGTSGAADFGSLRGDSGEAALGPGIRRVSSPVPSFWMNVCDLRKQVAWHSFRPLVSRKRTVRGPRKPTVSRSFARSGLWDGIVRVLSGFGWMAGGAGLSPQYWSDLVTGGVRADRVGAKLRRSLTSEWHEMPGGESRPASNPNNLGWHWTEASRSSREVRNGEDVTVLPSGGGRCGGRGPNPFRRLTPSPAQAGRAALNGRPGDRVVLRLCLWAVLVAEVDKRRLV